MKKPSIPPSFPSTMAPSTSHSLSTPHVSPSYDHAMYPMPPPKNSAGRKMSILRADSGIVIKPEINNAISNLDQLNSSSSALQKEDPANIIPIDTSGAIPTIDVNITNTIAKLDQLSTYLRTLLTRVPETPTAYHDDSTSTGEHSPEEEIPYTSAGKEREEDSCDTPTHTSEATIAEDVGGQISKVDQIVEVLSTIRHITFVMSSCLDEVLPKDPIIPEKHIEHRALGFQSVDKLSPARKWLFRPMSDSERLRRKMHRMKRWKGKEEQTPMAPGLLPVSPPPSSSSAEETPLQPTTPIISSNLPSSSSYAEGLHRRARTRNWVSDLPPSQEPKNPGLPALPNLQFLQRKIDLMKKELGDEFPLTPISNVLDPYFWTVRDATRLAHLLSSEKKKTPIPAPPKEKHTTHTFSTPPEDKHQQFSRTHTTSPRCPDP
ncbi:uncharacterized protein EAF02_008131 [Botrytis sinoallii]|uniref:uncharacterized protein n=1 Tax=Botrytis sinoallii TaxID=1463999 RepID=UPI001901A8F3|nr:uncharacterized protein EAF02_008131 [Botrytis sinoallii]KAF7876911.1 hypothetical protein EAF02_008131 [Botrytis sinoallii]